MWYSSSFLKLSSEKYPTHSKAWFDEEGNFIPFNNSSHEDWYQTPDAQEILGNKKYKPRSSPEDLIKNGWTRIYPAGCSFAFDIPFNIGKLSFYIENIQDYVISQSANFEPHLIKKINIIIRMPDANITLAFPLEIFYDLAISDIANMFQRKIDSIYKD